jgi:SAM-dependent methyltransferase
MAGHAAGSDEPTAVGFAVGLDLSRPMLEVARRLAAEADMRNVRFLQGDAQDCPLRSYSCDVIISSFGLMFFEDPVAAFASLLRIVRPHGRLAFLCWQDDRQNELLAIPFHAFAIHTQLPGPTVCNLFAHPGQIIRLLSGTGWKDIHIDAVTESAWMGSDVADVMTYVRGMPVIRSLLDSISNQALGERALASIAEQYAKRQRANGVWVRAAAWLVTATAPDELYLDARNTASPQPHQTFHRSEGSD